MEYNSTSQILPFKVFYSFSSIFEEIENFHFKDNEINNAISDFKRNLDTLIDGVESIEEFEKLVENISPIIEGIFPKSLIKNNLKALSFPYLNKYFFPTEDLKKILYNTGSELRFKSMELSAEDIYKFSCCLILKSYYGINIEGNQSNIIEIINGYSTYLSVNYDFDYFKITPKSKEFELSEDQIEELLNNYENTELWYSYFPQESWIAKGIAIATMFDTTTEVAISNLKSNLIAIAENQDEINYEANNALKSIFRLNDLEIGFSNFNERSEQFEGLRNKTVRESIILNHCDNMNLDSVYCSNLKERFSNSDYYVITNIDKYQKQFPKDLLVKNLQEQGIKSIILYPLRKDDEELGILEIASKKPGAFNRINALLLKDLIPLIENAIYKYTNDYLHQINSFIQTEFTALHPSVDWKFRNIAKELVLNPEAIFKKTEIKFKDVYPIYGEIDVRNSSATRNLCTKKDYQQQLNYLILVCEEFYNRTKENKFLDYIFQLKNFLQRVDLVDKIYFEREIFDYVSLHVHPEIPKYISEEDTIVKEYLMKLDEYTGLYYVERKKFDQSIQIINAEFSSELDRAQIQAQKIFPHYYERFRTDGIDFNLYVGRSISPNIKFDYKDLQKIRFWQLKTLINTELKYHQIKQTLPLNLDVASLIFTSNLTLDIVFKLDEKRFDVDGYNNAKYEIIKKRVNKAFVKNSNNRVNEPGKICVIYTEESIKDEYVEFFNQLISDGLLEPTIEFLEIENLQGIDGLLALRATIKFTN